MLKTLLALLHKLSLLSVGVIHLYLSVEDKHTHTHIHTLHGTRGNSSAVQHHGHLQQNIEKKNVELSNGRKKTTAKHYRQVS